MGNSIIVGFDEAKRVIDQIPKEVSHKVMSAAASKALQPGAKAARRKYREIAESTQEGYSKARAVATNVRIKRKRPRFGPGAFIYIRNKLIPVGDRVWPALNYAILMAYGSKKRSTRATKANRGKVDGFGNYIVEAGEENESLILSRYRDELGPELNKAVDRAVKKHGR